MYMYTHMYVFFCMYIYVHVHVVEAGFTYWYHSECHIAEQLRFCYLFLFFTVCLCNTIDRYSIYGNTELDMYIKMYNMSKGT